MILIKTGVYINATDSKSDRNQDSAHFLSICNRFVSDNLKFPFYFLFFYQAVYDILQTLSDHHEPKKTRPPVPLIIALVS